MCCSVKHEYDGQWNDKKTRLTTCDPHAQRVITSSDSPQEVEVGKDIIFTYDVDFKVRYICLICSFSKFVIGVAVQLTVHQMYYGYHLLLFSDLLSIFRRVISSGHLGGIAIYL
jgi:hypothetical protein